MSSPSRSFLVMSSPLVRPFAILLGLTGSFLINLSLPGAGTLGLLITLVIGMIPFLIEMTKQLLRRNVGVDVIALTAMATALFTQEYLTGCVILLMLSGGEALEAWAGKRAKKELTRLLSHVPTIAHVSKNNLLIDEPIDQIQVGTLIVIKAGEVIPIDGLVRDGRGSVDESTLTGESVPVLKFPGSPVLSGTINQQSMLTVQTLKSSEDSQYQRIVALVKDAERHKAPFVRLADRYAGWFTLMTFFMAGLAWIVSHDPTRFLAVLVVATPCPLILATPIALISGMSKAAARGIIMKHGHALETLASVRALVFDKTGTLTLGEPSVARAHAFGTTSSQELLWLGASLDQLSLHPFARALVSYARTHVAKPLRVPDEFFETFGDGVRGNINHTLYRFGSWSFVTESLSNISPEVQSFYAQAKHLSLIAVYIADETRVLGAIIFEDKIRPEIGELFKQLRTHRITHLSLLTGDHLQVAKQIGARLHITDVRAELSPQQKEQALLEIRSHYAPIAMIGDGVNDAPAMATADVSIALSAHGRSAASEASDVVITVNDISRVHDAIHIAQRVLKVAKQGIFFGMGASTLLMMLALIGYIPPLYGAVLQEILDVAVIFSVLRLHGPDHSHS